MRVLFVMPGYPLCKNHPKGGAVRMAGNFELLQREVQQLHVVRLLRPSERVEVESFEIDSKEARELRKQASSWSDVTPPEPGDRPASWGGAINSVLRPEQTEFWPYQAAKQLDRLVAQIKPDWLWVEATPNAAALAASSTAIHVLSHHDWLFRLRQFRRKSRRGTRRLRDWWEIGRLRRAEQRLLRRADGVVSISGTEARELSTLGCRDVMWLPFVVEDSDAATIAASPAECPRIVHLGSFSVTANAQGLDAYLDRVHPRLNNKASGGELVLVGDTRNAPDSLVQKARAAGATITGFVEDLASFLRPYDIAIIPYEQNTGFRTKLPVLLKHRQVVVATRASVQGAWLPGLDEVCCLTDGLDGFPAALARLQPSEGERRRLGEAGRKFFEAHYTPNAVEQKFHTFVAGIYQMAQGRR